MRFISESELNRFIQALSIKSDHQENQKEEKP